MKTIKRMIVGVLAAAGAIIASAAEAEVAGRWSVERANRWAEQNPWYCGFNQIPANAINDVEIWQKETFSPEVIRKEFELATGLGFNCVRIFLQYKVYEDDPVWFMRAFETYLRLADEAKLKVMPVLFDDCKFGPATDPTLGKQPEPLPGWGMWGWVPSPGLTMVGDPRTHGKLEEYLKTIILHHKDDPRIFMWDLYNETPGAAGAVYRKLSLALARKCFVWAREINPSQPLTICVWTKDKEANELVLGESDVITFHCYESAKGMRRTIGELALHGRPMICTEWLYRPEGSDIPSILPILKEARVGSMIWGLVNGKAQTQYPNGRQSPPDYNAPWKHDLYHADHTPYDARDLELIREATGKQTEDGK